MKLSSCGWTCALCAVALVVAAGPARAQRTTIKVDGEVIKSYVARMASNEAQGRRAMTPGYEKIADWAAGKFQEWGLQPAGDNGTYFQAVPIGRDVVWATGVPALSVDGRAFSLRDNDFQVDTQSSPGARAVGEVVFAGYGISAPAKGLDEYAGLDVTGKIVLVIKGSPKDAAAPRVSFAPAPSTPAADEAWADESADQAKIATAYGKGASAIVIYDPNPPVAMGMFGGGGGMRASAAPRSSFTRPFVVVSSIDARVLRTIMMREAQETVRGFGSRFDRMRWDIRNKKSRSVATGARAEIKAYDEVTVYSAAQKNNTSRNVIAKIDGTDPALKAQYVVLGGHMDHNGITNGVVMNGADDDASGAASVMELGRLLAVNKVRPKRTIVFALWTGEELGLLGSNYWTSKPTAGVDMERVVANFNFDMVGLGDRIGAPGALNFPAIWDVMTRDQPAEIMSLVAEKEVTGPGGSDYSGFITRGIESLALMTVDPAGHPDYHDAGDDTDKISADILGKNAQFVLQALLNVANETKVPVLIPDRLHLYNGLLMTVPSMKPGARGAWETIKASNPTELSALASARAKELVAASRPSAQAARPVVAMERQRRGEGQALRIARGVDAAAFGGSIPLLQASVAILDLGRVDFTRSDGAWVGDGLTTAGRAAVAAIEAAGAIIQLVKPSPRLLADVLDAASKPFVVTGLTEFDAATAAKMKQKNAIAVFDLNPAEAAGLAARLQAARKQFGSADSFLLTTTAENYDKARQDFYLSLVKNGWTKDEIYAMAGLGTNGRQGGPVLAKLGFTPPAGRPF